MKYLKSYKESTDWLLTEMEEYFSNIEYDLSVSKYRMKHTFKYQEDKYKIILRDEQYSNLRGSISSKWVPDLYQDSDDLPLYRNVQNLYLKIFKINLENIYLIQTILVFLDQKYNYSEITERLDEFEVIKNGSIDYISLENVFDFYNVEFNKDEFDLTLDRIRKMKDI